MLTATRSRSARLRRLQDEVRLHEQFIRLPTTTDDANDDGIMIGRWNRTDTEELMAAGHGRAAKFVSASSQYLSIADNASLSAGDIDFWLAAWMWLDSMPASNMHTIGKWGNGANNREYLLYWDNVSQRFYLAMSSNGTGATSYVSVVQSLATASWYFVIIYHDAVNNLSGMSINGGAFTTTAHANGVFDGPANFTIGTSAALVSFWDGRIAAVAFGKSPGAGIAGLATTIRNALYNSGNGRVYADLTSDQKTDWGLVSYWNLDELSGNRADSHGANDLAQTNSPLWAHGPTRSGTAGLVFSEGLSSHGDPGLVHPRIVRRRAGMAVEAKVSSRATNTIGPYLVLSNVLAFASAAQREHSITLGSTGTILVQRGATSFSTVYTYSADTDYYLLIVTDAAGAHYYASTDRINWTLLFVDPTGSTAALYAVLYSGTAAGTVTPIPVYRRSAKPPLVSAVGPFAAGNSHTAPAGNAIVRFKISTLGAGTEAGIEIKRADADNYIRVYYDQAAGVVYVTQQLAGVPSATSQVATYGATTEMQIMFNASTYRVYYGTTAIGGSRSFPAGLVNNTTVNEYSNNANNRLQDLYIEGGLP